LNSQNTGKISAIIPIIDFPRHSANILTIIKSAHEMNIELILILDSQPQFVYEQVVLTLGNLSTKGIVASVNSGNPGGARNIGLSLAKTDWIVFWDCDDLPNIFNVLDMIMQSEGDGSQVVIGNYEKEELQTKKITAISNNPKFWQIDVGLNPGIWRFAFKKEIIGSTRFPELKMGEDQVFLQRIFAKNPKVRVYDQIVYRYRLGLPNQLTSNHKNMNDLISSNVIARSELKEQELYLDTVTAMIIRQSLTLSKVSNFKFISRSFYFFNAIMYITKMPTIILRLVNLYKTSKGSKELKSAV
jgi:glycosyltransferase involved in cell wall biosynthesis